MTDDFHKIRAVLRDDELYVNAVDLVTLLKEAHGTVEPLSLATALSEYETKTLRYVRQIGPPPPDGYFTFGFALDGGRPR